MPHRATFCNECGYESELGYTVSLATPEQQAPNQALLPSWFFLAAALVGLFLLIATTADRSWGAIAFIYLGEGLISAGFIWAVVLAFQDEILDGFLCAICGFYLVYYVIMEWRTCRPAVLTGFLGAAMVAAGLAIRHYFVEVVV